MAVSMKNVDQAFQGVGHKLGMEIWRIEDFCPVPVPKAEYGKFYSGDSYIILMTIALKNGGFHHDIHFWLGKHTSQDEAGVAAIKSIELDAALGGRAVQYREVQGRETDKFLSYFKPCIIPLEGGVASGFKIPEAVQYEPRLYACRGHHVARVKEVPFARSSLNHDHVFILDTEFKIYQFNGSTSSIQERAKALQVVQHIKDTNHEGKCEVAIIDDGKLAEEELGEFWGLFGGFAPIGWKGGNDDNFLAKSAPAKLYCIVDGQPVPVETSPLSKGLLDSHKCYILDCGSDLFVWFGRITALEARKAASIVAEELVCSRKKSKSIRITRIVQGFEPFLFRTQFEKWPISSGTVTEDGRAKVAGLLKQQGVNVKGIVKASAGKEEISPPLLNANGKLEVWRINGSKKTPLSSTEVGKFYSGDCYIVSCTYPGEHRDEFYLCFWIGKHSVEEEQISALRLASQMGNLHKGRPVLGRIFQGKEPAQFIGLFENMIIHKGGLSSGYKRDISVKGISDDTYKEDGIALFRVRGTGRHNNQAIQVDLDSSCLNSSDCFILQRGAVILIWNGNSTTIEEQQLATRIVERLKPGVAPRILKEGSEPVTFWDLLGGKKSRPNLTEVAESGKDPRLFSCVLVNGNLQVSEVFNYTQDDLLSEDVMMVDAFSEVYIWVGQHAESKIKQQAFEIGQKYLERVAWLEGVPLDIPVFKVTEGNEPFFFTRHFRIWDPIKAAVQGNSFEKRVVAVVGQPIQSTEQKSKQKPKRNAWSVLRMNLGFEEKPSPPPAKTYVPEHDGPSQRADAMEALLSYLAEGMNPTSSDERTPAKAYVPQHDGLSQKAAAMAALLSSLVEGADSGSGDEKASQTSAKSYVLERDGPSQKEAAMAALLSYIREGMGPDASEKSSQTPAKFHIPDYDGPSQRAAAMAAILSSFSTGMDSGSTDKASQSSAKNYIPEYDGPSQRSAAMAALLSSLTAGIDSASTDKTSKSYTPEYDGPRQRSAAMAALLSSLTKGTDPDADEKTSQTPPKVYIPEHDGPSQREAAMAALLSSLTQGQNSGSDEEAVQTAAKGYIQEHDGPSQREAAMAALLSSLTQRMDSDSNKKTSQKAPASEQDGPSQKAAAMDALLSFLAQGANSGSNGKTSETPAKVYIPEYDGPTQRAAAMASLLSSLTQGTDSGSGDEKTSQTTAKGYVPERDGPSQKEAAMAALLSSLAQGKDSDSSEKASQTPPKAYIADRDGPSQKEAAMAALLSSLTQGQNSISDEQMSQASAKGYIREHDGPSQREAAMAALLSSLTQGMDSGSDEDTSSQSSAKSYVPEHDGPSQRATAMASLLSSLNQGANSGSNEETSQSSAKVYVPEHSGPSQKIAAMAALLSNEKSSQTAAKPPIAPEHSGPRQKGAAMAALLSSLTQAKDPGSAEKKSQTSAKAFGSSQRAAAIAALSSSLTEEKKVTSSRSSFANICIAAVEAAANNELTVEEKPGMSGALEAVDSAESVHSVEAVDSAEPVNPVEETAGAVPSEGHELLVAEKSKEVMEVEPVKGYVSYERLKTKSSDPISGIDPTKRESYLSPEDFRKLFKMDAQQFYALPRWKQDMLKKSLGLY